MGWSLIGFSALCAAYSGHTQALHWGKGHPSGVAPELPHSSVTILQQWKIILVPSHIVGLSDTFIRILAL